MTHPLHASTLPAPLAGLRLRRRLAALAGWLKAEILAWRTERELRELSDHMLRDVGLRRDEIASIARGTDRR